MSIFAAVRRRKCTRVVCLSSPGAEIHLLCIIRCSNVDNFLHVNAIFLWFVILCLVLDGAYASFILMRTFANLCDSYSCWQNGEENEKGNPADHFVGCMNNLTAFYIFRHVLFGLQAELDSTGYGKDVDSVHNTLEMQKQIHEEILNFQTEIAECVAIKVCFYCAVVAFFAEFSSRWSKWNVNKYVNLKWLLQKFVLLWRGSGHHLCWLNDARNIYRVCFSDLHFRYYQACWFNIDM